MSKTASTSTWYLNRKAAGTILLAIMATTTAIHSQPAVSGTNTVSTAFATTTQLTSYEPTLYRRIGNQGRRSYKMIGRIARILRGKPSSSDHSSETEY